MNDAIITATISYIRDLFHGCFGGHDAAHSLRVYRNALRIAEGEPDCDMEIVALAALLHDADDHKLFHTENNANARSFLTAQKVAPEKIERICEAINTVSFSQNRGKRPETLEGKIVQDADRLDALGAIGVARTFAYGGEHGRSLDESVAHFHEKLLLLKDELNTETARKLAEPRHAFLEQFLEEYEKESGE
ncbi:MAG: HD domain-containing protein [Oscillospiraceae bacterium]|nr:HD domain-containing protein [Oscillospiraceae bacterium]